MGAPCWDLPGGRIQKNESLEDALKREVFEETGLKNFGSITPFKIAVSTFRIPTSQGDVGLILAVYLCEINEDLIIHLSDEYINFSWFEPQKAAEQLVAANYPKELTSEIAKPVAEKCTKIANQPNQVNENILPLDDEDLIVKLTGRCFFVDDHFFTEIARDPHKDVYAKCVGSQIDYFIVCFAMRCKYFKMFLNELNFQEMEKEAIAIEWELGKFFQFHIKHLGKYLQNDLKTKDMGKTIGSSIDFF